MTLRAVIVLLAAVAGTLGTARLGLWQLDRAAQKTALHQALLERGALPPLDASTLARTPDAAVDQVHRRVQLEGRWLAEHSVYLDNRQMDGHPGFFLVTPLLIAPGDVVLVQRGGCRGIRGNANGWPRCRRLGRCASRPIASGLARLYEFDSGLRAIRQNRDRRLRANRACAAAWRSSGRGRRGLRRHGCRPSPMPKHHGWLQWFALSALITGLYVWFQLIRPWRRRSR